MADASMRLNLEERMEVCWSPVCPLSSTASDSWSSCINYGSRKAQAVYQGLGVGTSCEVEGAEFCALNRILRCYPSPLGHKIAIYKAHSNIG